MFRVEGEVDICHGFFVKMSPMLVTSQAVSSLMDTFWNIKWNAVVHHLAYPFFSSGFCDGSSEAFAPSLPDAVADSCSLLDSSPRSVGSLRSMSPSPSAFSFSVELDSLEDCPVAWPPDTSSVFDSCISTPFPSCKPMSSTPTTGGPRACGSSSEVSEDGEVGSAATSLSAAVAADVV